MRRSFLTVAAGFALAAQHADAQQLWNTPGVRQAIGINITKGFYPADDIFVPSALSAIAAARIALSPTTTLNLSVPFTRLALTVHRGDFGPPRDTTVTSTAFGNPMIGFETRVSSAASLDLAIMPGLSRSSDESVLEFAAVDDYDQVELWLPGITSVRAMMRFGRIPEVGGFVDGLFGGTYARSNGATAWGAKYGVRAGYRGRDVIVTISLTGRLRLNGDGSFDDRAIHQLEAALEGGRGHVRPRATVRTYLDSSIRQGVNAIVTAGLEVVF